MKITFITGNQNKADFLAKYLGHPVAHQKLDLDEIQSLSLEEVAGHKAKQAYGIIKSPVLVEDVGMTIEAMGKLPGPFIKWFELTIGLDGVCKMVDSFESRKASVSVCYIYYDVQNMKAFNGTLHGHIAVSPRGENGFGFDPVFIPDGFDKTLAEMSDDELKGNSLRTTTVYPQIKKFLEEQK